MHSAPGQGGEDPKGRERGESSQESPRAVEEGLLKAIPPEYLLNAHHWLLLHGRYVCKARKPDCQRCPVADLCAFKDKTLPQPTALPLAKPGKRSSRGRG